MLMEYLFKKVRVIMDRPLGSRHPYYPNLIYPVNYGIFQQGRNNPDSQFSGTFF